MWMTFEVSSVIVAVTRRESTNVAEAARRFKCWKKFEEWWQRWVKRVWDQGLEEGLEATKAKFWQPETELRFAWSVAFYLTEYLRENLEVGGKT